MQEIEVRHKVAFFDRSKLSALLILGVAILGSVGVMLAVRQCGAKDHIAGAPAPGTSAGCGDDGDCRDRQLCVSAACVDIQPGIKECTEVQVHFNTDSADIGAADKAAVARMARCLKADQSMKLVISGSTDERGSAAHNSELGEKRAMAVARTLQQQGVSSQQLSIVSYGEHSPLCLESDRDCWAKNRQAALTPSAGAAVAR
jgi:outer membrane protein OmpA-like peptidoglycan-associated protein